MTRKSEQRETSWRNKVSSSEKNKGVMPHTGVNPMQLGTRGSIEQVAWEDICFEAQRRPI
jgi:hypothetical protein